MRLIGHIESEEYAQVFEDYLFVHGIEIQTENGEGTGCAFWVVDEDRVDEAKALLSRFRSMPDAEEFYQASRAAAERRRGEKKEAREAEKKLKRPGAFPWLMGGGGLTVLLIIVCALSALLTRLGADAQWVGYFQISTRIPGLSAPGLHAMLADVLSGQVWRLFTPVLLHFSLWHLLFNMLWLRDLGGVLEARIGTWRFAGLVTLLAVVSNLSQLAAAGPLFGGMSGVVYGLFGFLWVRNRMDPHFGIFISQMTAGILMVFLALGLFGVLGPTANAAHFSGLLAGAALGWTSGTLAARK